MRPRAGALMDLGFCCRSPRLKQGRHGRSPKDTKGTIMSAPLHWSLLFGPLPTVLLVIGAMAACFLIIRPDRRWAGRVLPLVIALASTATAMIAWVINGLWRPFPDPLPVAVLIWVAVILSGMGLGLARLRLRGGVAEGRSSPCRGRRHDRRGESGQPILRLLSLGSSRRRTSPYSGASAAVVPPQRCPTGPTPDIGDRGAELARAGRDAHRWCSVTGDDSCRFLRFFGARRGSIYRPRI